MDKNLTAVLMERQSAGWRTELHLAEGLVIVTMQRGEDAEVERAIVDPAKALDAFNHPCCYLPVAS